MADYVDEYAYDSQGRLVAIAQYGAAGSNAVADKQITLGYNDQGLLATVTRYTDDNLAVLAQYSYDSAGRLTALVYSQGETILASYAWTYDTAADSVPSSSDQPSDITPQTSLHWLPSGGLMPGQDTGAIVNALWEGTGTPASLITEITSLDGTVSYSYDSAGQLLAATYTAGQAAEAYSYDAAGNRITANGAAYVTGPNNQLLFDGVFSYCYDPEGNRTARFIDVNANGLLDAGDTDATTYAWDHRNRLTRVTDYDLYGDPATRAVDYLYDVENRWIGRDVDLDADGQIDSQTRFIYDGNQIVLQFDRTVATAADPAEPLTLENLSHRYLWNPAAVDQLMADEQVTDPDVAGDIVWPLGDHQGTIRDLAVYDPTTDTTTGANHRTFDAYGNLQSQTNPAVDCLFAFTGRPLDQETGLQNNLHRWYDAAVGRWMSEDPIGFEGKDGNLYVYVGNGPVNAVDPNGLDPYAQMRLQMQLGWIQEAEAKKAEQEVKAPTRPSPPSCPVIRAASTDLSGLEQALVATLGPNPPDEAVLEAEAIAEAILAAHDANVAGGWWWYPWAGLQNSAAWAARILTLGTYRTQVEKYRGYYCYEWATFFWDAVLSVTKGNSKYFSSAIEQATMHNGSDEPPIHQWVRITSKITGVSVYVDDGFFNKKFVHSAPPIPGGWVPDQQ